MAYAKLSFWLGVMLATHAASGVFLNKLKGANLALLKGRIFHWSLSLKYHTLTKLFDPYKY